MKKEQVNETKERKSLKEVVYDNRGKIIAIMRRLYVII